MKPYLCRLDSNRFYGLEPCCLLNSSTLGKVIGYTEPPKCFSAKLFTHINDNFLNGPNLKERTTKPSYCKILEHKL